jgi:uncharacterized membrane protein YbhN (UPF0104 family)
MKRWALFIIRWSIAVAGIAWVVLQISWRDHVLAILAEQQPPQWVVLAEPAGEDSSSYVVLDPVHRQKLTLPRQAIVNPPDAKKVEVIEQGHKRQMYLLGLRLRGDINRGPKVDELYVAESKNGPARFISHQTAPGYRLAVPHPRVEVGVLSLYEKASPRLLVLAVLIFPVTFLLTSWRWHMLLRPLEIILTLGRTFVLNMVGAFYNTFMPGSTGGDVLKAYYASKHTVHRTRAVMSVFVDRVLGLLTLVIVGGAMAGVEYFRIGTVADPTGRMCLKVALGSAAIIGGTAALLLVYYHPLLRRISGLAWLLDRMPMQKQVRNAMLVMDIYRRRPGLIFWAVVMTVPVHLTVAASAMLAGKAFGLPIGGSYYFVAVPVIVLAGSIPISPQGAGVMEYFAIKLTEKQGTTVSQAFALAMSIRLVQMLWNLTGGILVFRGGYHAPSEEERRELDDGNGVAAAAAQRQA